MSTTCTWPANSEPGSRYRPGFAKPSVTVMSAGPARGKQRGAAAGLPCGEAARGKGPCAAVVAGTDEHEDGRAWRESGGEPGLLCDGEAGRLHQLSDRYARLDRALLDQSHLVG